MSGHITPPKMFSRRELILTTVATGGLVYGYTQFNHLKKIWQNSIVRQIPIKSHNQAVIGHRLREPFNPEGYIKSEAVDTLILGAGISGLSCGYHLYKSGLKDFLILEMSDQAGGNSSYFKESTSSSDPSAASWGAHYLPIPSLENKYLINFLTDHQIITGFENGLPIYNEEYLCHEPHERLQIRGSWQNSLVPHHGLSPDDLTQIKRFEDLTENLKKSKGRDHKWAFDIPVDQSSQDPQFLNWDKISFEKFLEDQGFTSEALLWLCQYSCLDDFGTALGQISAWAGLHYFSSRRGVAANAEPGSDLVWPEGNGFLKDLLVKPVEQKIRLNHLIRHIEKNKNSFKVYYENILTNEKQFIDTRNLVSALPRYVHHHLNPQIFPKLDLSYFPWLVAHIKIKRSILESQQSLAWDTVKYLSTGLGYINNDHQKTNSLSDEVLITYYYAFADSTAKNERQTLYGWTDQKVKEFVVNELSSIHYGIESYIQRIDYKILGHAMISPQVHYIWEKRIKNLPRIQNDIIFAHTDMSGISIFEEAFEHGRKAANLLLKSKNGLS